MSRKTAVVMAAGKGTRMKSDMPKVLVEVAGRPMIDYVLDSLKEGGIERIIVIVGYRAELVRAHLSSRSGIEFAEQSEQLGTGHAVMSAQHLLNDRDAPVLVVAGDSPMMESASIRALMAEYVRRPAACVIGTTHKDDPTGLGRILRDEGGGFVGIVEEKDATPEQKAITEINMSYYVFHCGDLLEALGKLRNDNVQGEYYITDCPGLFRAIRKEVRALPVLKPSEALGVNTFEDVCAVEEAMRQAAEARRVEG